MDIKKIQTQLKAMVTKDQEMRVSGKWKKGVDLENVKKLKTIIQKIGWPDTGLVGQRASHFAWLIAQHADCDIRFQERCLKLLKEKQRQKKSDPIEIAYLTDRIRVNRGKKQVYGTQFYINKNRDLVPRPIQDKKNLDKWRKKVGLENFEQYRKRLVKKQVGKK